MARVRSHAVPAHALHAKYGRDGGYADCFITEIARPVTHAQFVTAFYTTWLFNLERFFLAWTVDKPSTDSEVRALARGERTTFAAWSLEERAPDQLLMRDYLDKTRSWFMVEPGGDAASTRLYFGTGIVATSVRRSGEKRLSGGFNALLGFHKLYARALLRCARSRLERSRA